MLNYEVQESIKFWTSKTFFAPNSNKHLNDHCTYDKHYDEPYKRTTLEFPCDMYHYSTNRPSILNLTPKS